jgi:hypothetical protein
MAETSTQVFHRLGAGSFATVYACTAWASVAVKQVADPARTTELEREHAALTELTAAWPPVPAGSAGRLTFHVPFCLELHADFADFAAANDVQHDAASANLGLGALYMMERVWTVPPPLAKRIRHHCFPDAFKDDVRPFLGRIYFGQRRALSTGRFFNPLNFAITPACLAALGLPCERLAASMGAALARIHFVAGFDGRDVEFVLGGATRHANVEPAFFVIDFNQMRRVPPDGGDAVVQLLAEAVWTNDPYVPRADSPFWPAFRAAYEAEAAHSGAVATAQAVLAALQAHWQDAAQVIKREEAQALQA